MRLPSEFFPCSGSHFICFLDLSLWATRGQPVKSLGCQISTIVVFW